MKTYSVLMPFAGSMTLEVEAENEDDAKEKFYEEIEQVSFKMAETDKKGIDVCWDFHEKIVGGNVCYAEWNNMEIEEIE